MNDACVLLGKPNVYGSIFRFEGQSTVFCTDEGPCYRCLYPEPPPPGLVPSCAEGGVLGILPGLVGLVQATETVKLIAGIGEPLVGRLLLVDARADAVPHGEAPQGPALPGVRHAGDQGAHRLPAVLRDPARRGRDEGRARHHRRRPRRARRRKGDDLDLVDVREAHEWDIGRIEGARLAPLSRFADALRTFDSARDVVVYCRSGVRSAKAVKALQEAGFKRVWNLEGGILRWSEEIDPDRPPLLGSPPERCPALPPRPARAPRPRSSRSSRRWAGRRSCASRARSPRARPRSTRSSSRSTPAAR